MSPWPNRWRWNGFNFDFPKLAPCSNRAPNVCRGLLPGHDGFVRHLVSREINGLKTRGKTECLVDRIRSPTKERITRRPTVIGSSVRTPPSLSVFDSEEMRRFGCDQTVAPSRKCPPQGGSARDGAIREGSSKTSPCLWKTALLSLRLVLIFLSFTVSRGKKKKNPTQKWPTRMAGCGCPL